MQCVQLIFRSPRGLPGQVTVSLIGLRVAGADAWHLVAGVLVALLPSEVVTHDFFGHERYARLLSSFERVSVVTDVEPDPTDDLMAEAVMTTLSADAPLNISRLPLWMPRAVGLAGCTDGQLVELLENLSGSLRLRVLVLSGEAGGGRALPPAACAALARPMAVTHIEVKKMRPVCASDLAGLAAQPCLETLILSDVGLTSAALSGFAHVFTDIRRLDLSTASLAGSGAVLARLIHACKHLSTLSLASCQLAAADVRRVCEAAGLSASLAKLSLADNGIRGVAVSDVVYALTQLRELNLSGNRIADIGAEILIGQIDALTCDATLRCLIVQGCDISDRFLDELRDLTVLEALLF